MSNLPNLPNPLQDQALEWVRSKWGQDRKCEICGARNWAVSEPMTVQTDTMFGGVYRFVPVGCTNCGNTHLLNMTIIGASIGS